MNAVLEKPLTKARARKTAPAAAVPAPALFEEVGDFLAEAAGTNEDHAFSGDSDRLLSIGAMIAFDAAKGKFSNTTAENTAYDVAACINAARLVPEDSESVERTVQIDNAALRLEIITGTAVHRMIFTDVRRPSRQDSEPAVPAPVKGAKEFSEEQYNELYWQAYVYMDSARSVLFQYAEHASSEEVLALRDLLDMYCSTAHATFEAKDAGNLSSGPLPNLSADLSKIIHLFYAVNDDGRDDGVLHGVNYLLKSAKRITDGDEGVLG
ncbi:MAG: hypothetical protein RSG22_14935 [Comamonas sp.]